MVRYTLLPIILLLSTVCSSQLYDDYLGAGHDKGIKVWSSSDQGAAVAANTINGVGLDAMKIEASRFLAQAAFGGSEAEVIDLVELDNDFNAWIEDQFSKETTWMLPKLWEVNEKAERLYYMEYDTLKPGRENFDYFGPFSVHFEYSWWDNLMKGEDQLRQRIAYALSQIFVISINSQLSDYGEGLASYYDHFMRNSFGNYKDIMMDVTLDPNMGFYLSHLNNQKTNIEDNISPDENYAREIMQLFSIGLYQLNNDGSRKTDQGEWIPTYNNEHIKGLAKVMTGLKGGEWSESAIFYGRVPGTEVEFGANINAVEKTVPLVMDENFHELGAKTILDDFVIPAGQTGMQDIEMAVDYLFNHDNVGPFVARRLIQQLVKSNPTPAYINRVANVFNGNAGSPRGDMKALIKAVLLDDEARTCNAINDPLHGKLREPMMRFTHILRAIPTYSATGDYWNNSFDFLDDTRQAPLAAPSVFNFYLPDYQAGGEITNQGAFSPEFQIHNTQTALGYIQQAHKWTSWGSAFWDWVGREDCKNSLEEDREAEPPCEELTPNVVFVWDELRDKAADIETLVNYLDVMMVHGRLSADTREIITDACGAIGDRENRARTALYLIMISPDYVVLK